MHWGRAGFIDYPVEKMNHNNAHIPDKKVADTSSKQDVKWLQETLNKLDNAGLAVDGIYGAKTLAAHEAFSNKYRHAVI